MYQTLLFEIDRQSAATPPPMPPASGSATSQAAAQSITQDTNGQRAAVLEFIRSMNVWGATDQEVQQQLDMGGSTQRPRRRELQQAGLIEDSGQTRPTCAGRQAILWVAVRTTNKNGDGA